MNTVIQKYDQLEKKDFDINELIRQSIATFEGRCKEKKIGVFTKQGIPLSM